MISCRRVLYLVPNYVKQNIIFLYVVCLKGYILSLSKASDTQARNLSNILRKSTCPISCASSCAINLPKFFGNCAQHVRPVTYAIKWRHSILNAFITAKLYCATSIKFVKTTYNCKFNNFLPCLCSYVCRNQAYLSIKVTYVIQPALKHMP